MNPANNNPIYDLVFFVLLAITVIIVTYLFFKSSRNQAQSGDGMYVKFDDKTWQHVRNVKQRCEHADELEVISRALTSYDVLTEAIAEGKEIILVDRDGNREKLDLFPINEG